MTDLNSIASVLTSLKAATDIAKLIQNSNNSLEKAEQKMKLADLIDSLADAKMQIAEVRIEMIEKNETIKSLSDKLIIKGQTTYEAPYYWVVENEKKDGPFCQKCHDTDSKYIRLQNLRAGNWKCENCTGIYRDKDYKPPSTEGGPTSRTGPNSWMGR